MGKPDTAHPHTKNGVPSHEKAKNSTQATAWMTQQDIMSSEMSQDTRQILCDSTPGNNLEDSRSTDTGRVGTTGSGGEKGGLPRMVSECLKGTELECLSLGR